MKFNKYVPIVLLLLTGLLTISCGAKKNNTQTTSHEYEIKEIFASNNGQRIYGVAYIPTNATGSMPAVIYSHGFSGTLKNGTSYAESLAQNGYVVYSYDFRGGSSQSKSEGSTTEMSIFTEKSDLEAVLQMVEGWEFVDKNKIFLLGASQGGMVSSMVAADYPARISGLMLLYPAYVIPDDARKLYNTVDDVPETVELMGMTIGKEYYINLFDFDTYEYIKRYPGKVLIIHGDRDELVPLNYSEKAVEAYPDAELKVIPGAGHGFKEADEKIAIGYILKYMEQNRK